MSMAARRPSLRWAAAVLAVAHAALWLVATPAFAREAAPVTEAAPAEGTVAAAAPAAVAVPALTGPVVDLTATLDAAAAARLSERSLDLQRRKGAQLMLLLIDSTGGEDIAAYAQRVFEQWKPGRAGIDDGVLVVVAKRDRRMRIHLGRGLDDAVGEQNAARIIEEILTPAFRDDDYAGGLTRAYDALIGLIDGTPLPEPEPDRLPWPLMIFAGLMVSPFVLIPLFGMRAAWRRGPLAFFGRLAIIAAVAGGAYLLTLPKIDPDVAEWERWMPMALLTYIATAFLSVSAFAGGGSSRGPDWDDYDERERERRRRSSSSSSSGSSSSGSYSGGGGRSDGGGSSGSW
ncbi:TPM domain-containing protein [Lysobacter enzymogenes]|uniref:TPM domain-containing protein n=1 Tax=Lysobacter enzymogenes TaxID=69 RepID=UPI001A971258|nr:TPM domain-containing protein [Lysobacter enzymogenes]QQP98350.1 TPM domain-containing protein [Lysobacter enzymogenes]